MWVTIQRKLHFDIAQRYRRNQNSHCKFSSFLNTFISTGTTPINEQLRINNLILFSKALRECNNILKRTCKMFDLHKIFETFPK